MRLILNGDDLGHDAAVDAAARDGLREGWLTSVSLMATGPTFADAAAMLREQPGAGVGVHLDLSEHRPLTPVPSLRPWLADGRLSPACRHAGFPHLPDVLDEWSAQVQRVLDAGLRPDHLDSHQHLHYQPVLLRALLTIRRRFRIPAVRGKAAGRPDAGPLRDHVQRLRARAFRARLRLLGARTTDGFGSVALFRALLDEGRLPYDTFEVMVHPGAPGAEAEVAWLRGPGQAALQAAQRVTWGALGPGTRPPRRR